jgi:hypothetical protein
VFFFITVTKENSTEEGEDGSRLLLLEKLFCAGHSFVTRDARDLQAPINFE